MQRNFFFDDDGFDDDEDEPHDEAIGGGYPARVSEGPAAPSRAEFNRRSLRKRRHHRRFAH